MSKPHHPRSKTKVEKPEFKVQNSKFKVQKPKTKGPRPKPQAVAAILLAAGRSERMGAFKPLLPFGKTTVIRTCIRNLRDAGVEKIVIVLGHRADEVKQSLSDLNIELAHNPDPDSEMSASIVCGVRELPPDSEAALIALTDQPAVPPEVIKAVIDQWTSGNKLVIPEFQGRGGHPVLIDLSLRGELLNLDPGRGLKGFFDAHKPEVRRLPVNSPYVARDMDTWDDYRTLHEEICGYQPGAEP